MTFRPHPKQAAWYLASLPRTNMVLGLWTATHVEWLGAQAQDAFRAGWQAYGRRLAADRRRAGR